MKHIHIALFIVALSISSLIVSGEDDAGQKRNNVLLRRGPANRAGLASKSTSTAAPKHVDEDIGDEEYEQEQSEDGEDVRHEEDDSNVDSGSSSTTSTSTEPLKKIGPVIRPFRTNDDFLTALKRRQMNAKKVGHTQPKAEKPHHNHEEAHEEDKDEVAPETPSVAKLSKGVPPRRNKFGKSLKPAAEPIDSSNDEESPAPASGSNLKRLARPSLKSRTY